MCFNRVRMLFWKIFLVVLVILFLPDGVFARTTPNDLYQVRREQFTNNLNKISDPKLKQTVEQFDTKLNEVNQNVCNKFDLDIQKLSAILEEEKARQKTTETIVAYGRGETPMDNAAYYLNYAAEAIAYQRSQDYTPQIGNNPKAGLSSSLSNLKSDLRITQTKVLRAKSELKKTLEYYEK